MTRKFATCHLIKLDKHSYMHEPLQMRCRGLHNLFSCLSSCNALQGGWTTRPAGRWSCGWLTPPPAKPATCSAASTPSSTSALPAACDADTIVKNLSQSERGPAVRNDVHTGKPHTFPIFSNIRYTWIDEDTILANVIPEGAQSPPPRPPAPTGPRIQENATGAKVCTFWA